MADSAHAHEASSLLDRVDLFLAETGLESPRRPSGAFPRMPEEPSNMPDELLMTEYAKTNAWCEYLDFAIGIAEAETQRRTVAESVTEARAIRDSRETSMKGKERMAELDEGRLAAHRQMVFAWEHETLLKQRLKGLERIATVLSRELTRRTSAAGLLRGSATGWAA